MPPIKNKPSQSTGQKQSSPSASSHSSERPDRTPINVAVIGLIGALLVAIIGAIVTIYTNRFTIEVPIQTTQSAVAQQTTAALSVTATSPPIPTNTITQASNTATPIQLQDLLDVQSSCGALIRVLPTLINLDEDIDTALEQLRPDFNMEDLSTCKGAYPLGPIVKDEYNGLVPIDIYITNILQHPGDIQIENTFTIIVHPIGDIPNESSALTISAGAAGEIRRFPPIELRLGSASYTNKRTFEGEKTDFFFIAPGQFEGFEVPFSCTNPGEYIVIIKVPYRYLAQRGEIQFQPQQITCPKLANVWSVIQDTSAPEPRSFEKYRIGTYTWSEGKYIEGP